MIQEFLEFVAQRGLLSREQLAYVRSQLRRAPEPIGMLAFRHGMISGADIDRILDAQRSDGRVFGELAVEMGILTPAQVESLLGIQRCLSAVEVAEALALSGLVPVNDIMTTLGEFLTTHGNLAVTAGSTPAEHNP